jgi:hypothetical protein
MRILKCDKCRKEYLKILKLEVNDIFHVDHVRGFAEKEAKLRQNIDIFIGSNGDFCPQCYTDLEIKLYELTECVLGENK